ncbi:MAG: extracellular solute-binding protein [Vallitalea sp.]|jgi:putative aldouronate transport system substrate-binding protein|nr:extracellular solute-binding protein [Vallitalea sp.]
MTSFKKMTAIFLILVMGIVSMSGCAKEQKADTNKTAKQNNGETKKEKNSTPIKIDWLAYNCYAQPDKNSEIVKKMEEKFNADFNFWFVDDQRWDEVLGVKLAGGDMPDIMRIKNTANISNYVKQGILAEITPEMLAQLPKFNKNIESVIPADDKSGFKDCYYNGKLYAIKYPIISGSYPTILVWRTDWLKKYGIDKVPTTLDEFEDAIYKFALEDPDGNNKKDTFGLSNTVMNAVFGAFGPIPLKEFRGTGTQNLFYTIINDRVEFACVQPEMKDALAKLSKWYKDGVIDPEFITGENKGGYWAVSQDFENGKVGVTGMCLASHWQPPNDDGKVGSVYDSFMKVNPDAKWKDTVYIGGAIKGPKGKAGTHCWGAFSSAGFAITTKALEDPKKLDTILNIIEQNSSDFDTYVLNRYGIEGKHHKINDKGIYEKMDPYNDLVEGGKVGIDALSIGFNSDFEKKAAPTKYTFLDKFKTEGYSDVLVPSTKAAEQYLTDLKTFTLNAYIKIITGEEDIDYFDTFVKEFNKLGGKQIIEEINSSIGN